jgi:hypothetical protein
MTVCRFPNCSCDFTKYPGKCFRQQEVLRCDAKHGGLTAPVVRHNHAEDEALGGFVHDQHGPAAPDPVQEDAADAAAFKLPPGRFEQLPPMQQQGERAPYIPADHPTPLQALQDQGEPLQPRRGRNSRRMFAMLQPLEEKDDVVAELHDDRAESLTDALAAITGDDRQAVAERQPGAKPSNPKDSLGILKHPLSTVSMPVIAELGVGMLEGSMKYGRHNYRAVGVRASVYFDATFRHLAAWWEGQDIDPLSGINHVGKAIASLFVLRDSMIRGNWVDDRPPAVDADIWDDLNERVKKLNAQYPTPVAPYTEKPL